jgi:hypothetical protein
MTQVIRLTNKSGSSFTIDVTALGLSSNTSEIDFYVTHNGANATSNYTKTNQTTLTYSGPSVAAGTIIQAGRRTIIAPEQLTITSSTQQSNLVQSINLLKRNVEDVAAHLEFIGGQLEQGGATILPAVVKDEPYGSTWNGDITYAPSRNSVYQRINQIVEGNNTLTGSYNFSNAANISVPTVSNAHDKTTKAASTAFVHSAIDKRLLLLAKMSSSQQITDFNNYNPINFNTPVIDSLGTFNASTNTWTFPNSFGSSSTPFVFKTTALILIQSGNPVPSSIDSDLWAEINNGGFAPIEFGVQKLMPVFSNVFVYRSTTFSVEYPNRNYKIKLRLVPQGSSGQISVLSSLSYWAIQLVG